jgi:polar amino acid transport system permease protein
MSSYGRLLEALPDLARGLWVTLELTALAAVTSFVVGHLVWWMRGRSTPLWRGLGHLYVSMMRGVPSIVQLFIVFFSLPLIGLGGKPLLAALFRPMANTAACPVARVKPPARSGCRLSNSGGTCLRHR